MLNIGSYLAGRRLRVTSGPRWWFIRLRKEFICESVNKNRVRKTTSAAHNLLMRGSYLAGQHLLRQQDGGTQVQISRISLDFWIGFPGFQNFLIKF